MTSRIWGTAIALAIALNAAPAAADATLDYEFFKTRVEPIFLKKRDDHVRCYVCHSEANTAFKLEKLADGAKFWSEEQSRRQFDVVSKLVVPGKPTLSRLLLQPLALEAGGNPYHSGGRQFSGKNDPNWKILEQWVNGQKVAAK
jgi:hypothetical protein